jgi:hypothetical protein
MKRYEDKINTNRLTVTISVEERLKDYEILNDNVIRPIENAYYKE